DPVVPRCPLMAIRVYMGSRRRPRHNRCNRLAWPLRFPSVSGNLREVGLRRHRPAHPTGRGSLMTEPKNYLMDMDGVLVRGAQIIPGAVEFIQRLRDRGRKFMVMTNNPMYTPGDLAYRLRI